MGARTRLHVNEKGELVGRDGVVLGRLVSVTIELEGGTLRRGEAFSGDSQSLESEANDNSLGGVGEGQGSMLPDPVNEVWDYYVATVNRPKAQLTAKVRTWIAAAIKAVGVDDCKLAIDGLAASDYHRQNGYVGIEYALKPKQGQTIESRVAFMKSKAGHRPDSSNTRTTVQELMADVPSGGADIVRLRMERVRQMLDVQRKVAEGGSMTHADQDIVAEGELAVVRLRESTPHCVPIIEDHRLTGWRRVA